MTLPTLWLKHLIVEGERRQRKTVEARLAALHARINPHFLFNSLNAIANLIVEDPIKAEDVVLRLAEVFHYVLDTDPRELVPLRREIAYAEDFLHIQGARFEERLTHRIDVTTEVEDVVVRA